MRRGRWGAGGAVCWRGDLVQVVQGGGIIGAARGAGLLLAVVVIIGAAQVVQGAQAAQHHLAGRPRRARPRRKEKAQGGGAGGARVALGLCRQCWSAADPAGLRRGRFAVCRRGQILHFTG